MKDLADWIDYREATEGRRLRGKKVWLFPEGNGEITAQTHANWTGRAWRRARDAAADRLLQEGHETPAEIVRGAVPDDLRMSAVSCAVRAAGRDLDWSALARQFGHTVETLQEHYLRELAHLRRAPRIPVEQQIIEARAAAGSLEPLEAIMERAREGQKPGDAGLIKLSEVRRRRAS
jgi:hypothetical protein